MNVETAQPSDVEAPMKENFAELLEEFLGETPKFEGRVVKGTVLSIEIGRAHV